MATIYDIARIAGVSPTTVSRVLNGSKNVKKETRDKVMSVIVSNNFVPNLLARNLSIGESQIIAFLVPDIDNPFFTKLLHGITDIAMSLNYNVFMFGTDENVEREHKVLASLKTEMIKGIIIIPVAEGDNETKMMLLQLRERNMPVVLIDRDIRGGDFDGVFSEDRIGVIEAMRCLNNEGHTDIAIITGPQTNRPGYERLKGYKKALEVMGIKLNPEYVVDGAFRVKESYEAMNSLMQLKNPPTAILASNNLTTLGCLKYMKDHGLIIGKDISLISFDDIVEFIYTEINLTAIDRPVYAMGCEAMMLLENRFQQDHKDRLRIGFGVVRRNFVKTQLIKRGSEKYERFEKVIAEKRSIRNISHEEVQ